MTALSESGSPAWYPQFLTNQVQSQRAVYVYPVEYNVYGMESSPELSYQFNKTTRAWEKRYKIYDYIGNLRILANSSGTVLEKHSYTPYGEELKTSADLSKTTWLGKERDAESGLGE